MKPRNAHPTFHNFGRWRFDRGTGDLSDGKTTTRLEPQVARLLDYCVTHQDTLISRDDLIADVWDGRVVSDDAINRCVSILRNCLTPDNKNAYIETVVRRGFLCHFPPPDAVDGETRSPRSPGRYLIAGAAVVVALLAVVAVWFSDRPPSHTSVAESGVVPIVAVLPFTHSGLERDSEFFAKGVHDDLLTQLAQLQSIRVISRTSVMEYRNQDRNIREIGRELGADAILEGGVQRIGEKIRINVQLIDAQSDVHLWAENYDRDLTPASIFDVQSEISRSIASALHSNLTAHDNRQLDTLPTENMAAYRAYHEAIDFRNAGTIGEAAYVEALERAVALDPGFIRAWAELAGSLSYMNFSARDPASLQRLEQILERIRSLAPLSSDYLIAQSYFTYYVLRDNDKAHQLISEARYLKPSDPQVLDLMSWIERRRGNFDGVIEAIRQGRLVDPKNSYWMKRLVSALIYAHRYDDAESELSRTSFDDFRLALHTATLDVRRHREPQRLLDTLVQLEKEYGQRVEAQERWETHIAGRDFAGAADILDTQSTQQGFVDEWNSLTIPNYYLAWVITDHFHAAETPAGKAPVALLPTAADPTPGFGELSATSTLAHAISEAVGGNSTETERLVRQWLRDAESDQAVLIRLRHYACRALGLAGSAAPAVECLRAAAEEPSEVMPFIEPYLPYYDAVRDDPRFASFVEEANRG